MPMFKKPLIILLAIISLLGGGYLFFDDSHENNLDIGKINAVGDKENTVNKEALDETIAVYINGEVANPGVVILKKSAYLSDAILAAGDLTPLADTEKINPATILKDGTSYNIPAKNNTNKKEKEKSNDGKININTADESELKTLNGIGESTAKKIIEHRKEKGNFNTIEDLKNVKGIGKGKFEKIKDKITV